MENKELKIRGIRPRFSKKNTEGEPASSSVALLTQEQYDALRKAMPFLVGQVGRMVTFAEALGIFAHLGAKNLQNKDS